MEEVRACIICGSNRKITISEAKDRLHHIDGEFRLVQCAECGLVYLSPRPSPSEMARYYPSDYEPFTSARNASLFRRIDLAFGINKRCKAVADYKPSGRILDIGCATGNFLSGMRNVGWETYGVEINEHAAQMAAKENGLKVFCGELEDARFANDSFDVVTLWDVIEHLYSPKAVLQEIGRILKSDGLLLISTPDVLSLDASIYGKYWAGLDAPRHLFLFSIQTLGLMLQESGYEIIGRRYFTGNYFTFVQSLRFVVEDMPVGSKSAMLARTLVNLRLFRVGMLPYFAVINRANKGPVMTVFARKRKHQQ